MSRAKTPPAPVATTLGGLVEGAFSEFSSLADEMQEAYDNTPENLQASGVGEARGAAADELQNYVDAPEVPASVADLPATYLPLAPRKRGYSRRDRAGQATYELGIAVELLDAEIEKLEDQIGKTDDDTREEELEQAKGDLEECRDECQNAIDGVDGVEFPGMFG